MELPALELNFLPLQVETEPQGPARWWWAVQSPRAGQVVRSRWVLEAF